MTAEQLQTTKRFALAVERRRKLLKAERDALVGRAGSMRYACLLHEIGMHFGPGAYMRHYMDTVLSTEPLPEGTSSTRFASVPAHRSAVAIAIVKDGQVEKVITDYEGLPKAGPGMMTVSWSTEDRCLWQAKS